MLGNVNAVIKCQWLYTKKSEMLRTVNDVLYWVCTKDLD
jgi:hypothetical protein